MSIETKVLDHGYVRLVEAWGSDERIIEAARMSTAKGFLGWGGEVCPACLEAGLLDPHDKLFVSPQSMWIAEGSCRCKGTGKTIGDEKLLKFLWDHAHATPFEMAGLTIEAKAPIFVFREWHRHRTQSFNEMSARYVPLPDENYVPSIDRLMTNSRTNKQAGTASDSKELTTDAAVFSQRSLRDSYQHEQEHYEWALRNGVPKELARLCLPVGRYSCMRASANLRNWLAFLKLRCAPNAQFEIRQYADAVAALVKQHFPRTYEVARESVGMP